MRRGIALSVFVLAIAAGCAGPTEPRTPQVKEETMTSVLLNAGNDSTTCRSGYSIGNGKTCEPNGN